MPGSWRPPTSAPGIRCILPAASAAPAPSSRVGASIPAATGVYLQMQAAAAAAAAQQQEMVRRRTGSGSDRRCFSPTRRTSAAKPSGRCFQLGGEPVQR